MRYPTKTVFVGDSLSSWSYGRITLKRNIRSGFVCLLTVQFADSGVCSVRVTWELPPILATNKIQTKTTKSIKTAQGRTLFMLSHKRSQAFFSQIFHNSNRGVMIDSAYTQLTGPEVDITFRGSILRTYEPVKNVRGRLF